MGKIFINDEDIELTGEFGIFVNQKLNVDLDDVNFAPRFNPNTNELTFPHTNDDVLVGLMSEFDKVAARSKLALDSVIMTRTPKYPSVGDQLDAIIKWASSLRADGMQLPQEMNDLVDTCEQIKTDYPKPE